MYWSELDRKKLKTPCMSSGENRVDDVLICALIKEGSKTWRVSPYREIILRWKVEMSDWGIRDLVFCSLVTSHGNISSKHLENLIFDDPDQIFKIQIDHILDPALFWSPHMYLLDAPTSEVGSYKLFLISSVCQSVPYILSWITFLQKIGMKSKDN